MSNNNRYGIGPCKAIHFNHDCMCTVVTCGDLCPGMNTVTYKLVVGLWELNDDREIFRIMSGYWDFYADEPVRLDQKMVHD